MTLEIKTVSKGPPRTGEGGGRGGVRTHLWGSGGWHLSALNSKGPLGPGLPPPSSPVHTISYFYHHHAPCSHLRRLEGQRRRKACEV